MHHTPFGGMAAMDQSRAPMATAVSLMRFEKPHSLSYQDSTRTNLSSMTLVWSRAKVEDAGSWLKSIETFGWSVTARMPRSGPRFEALTMASLIFSTEVLRFEMNLKSTTETFGVGTRIEVPSRRPLSSGMTRPIALAAPVEVGIIDIAAARPR